MKKTLSIEQIKEAMRKNSYICDDQLAFVICLSLAMEKPLLLEGEPWVGKTEVAKVLADVLGAKLIRLQCYEGLDSATTLYEWNYAKQMIRVQIERGMDHQAAEVERSIFSEDFLLKRPLLEALTETEGAPVLLIDEID